MGDSTWRTTHIYITPTPQGGVAFNQRPAGVPLMEAIRGFQKGRKATAAFHLTTLGTFLARALTSSHGWSRPIMTTTERLLRLDSENHPDKSVYVITTAHEICREVAEIADEVRKTGVEHTMIVAIPASDRGRTISFFRKDIEAYNLVTGHLHHTKDMRKQCIHQRTSSLEAIKFTVESMLWYRKALMAGYGTMKKETTPWLGVL